MPSNMQYLSKVIAGSNTYGKQAIQRLYMTQNALNLAII